MSFDSPEEEERFKEERQKEFDAKQQKNVDDRMVLLKQMERDLEDREYEFHKNHSKMSSKSGRALERQLEDERNELQKGRDRLEGDQRILWEDEPIRDSDSAYNSRGSTWVKCDIST